MNRVGETQPCINFSFNRRNSSHVSLLIAVDAIVCLAAVLSAYALRSHLGNWSFAVGAVGPVFSLASLSFFLSTSEESLSLPKNEAGRSRFRREKEGAPKSLPKNEAGRSRLPREKEGAPKPKTTPSPLLSTYDCTCKDCLNPHEKANSEQLSIYIEYLSTKYPWIQPGPGNYGAEPLSKIIDWLKKGKDPLPNWFFREQKSIPIYLDEKETHWSLLFIDAEKRTVEYYNGIKDYIPPKELQRQLNEMAKHLPKIYGGKPFKVHIKVNERLQLGATECGWWVLYLLEKRLENPDFDFSSLTNRSLQEGRKLIEDYRLQVLKRIRICHAQKAIESRILTPEEATLEIKCEECSLKSPQRLSPHHFDFYGQSLAEEHPSILSVPSSPYQVSLRELDRFLQGKKIQKELPNFTDLIQTGKKVPIYISLDKDCNDWALVVIDPQERGVHYFSARKDYPDISLIQVQLRRIAGSLTKKFPDNPPYKFEIKVNADLLSDELGSDYWTLFFMREILNPDYDPKKSNDIPRTDPAVLVARLKRNANFALREVHRRHERKKNTNSGL